MPAGQELPNKRCHAPKDTPKYLTCSVYLPRLSHLTRFSSGLVPLRLETLIISEHLFHTQTIEGLADTKLTSALRHFLTQQPHSQNVSTGQNKIINYSGSTTIKLLKMQFLWCSRRFYTGRLNLNGFCMLPVYQALIGRIAHCLGQRRPPAAPRKNISRDECWVQ